MDITIVKYPINMETKYAAMIIRHKGETRYLSKNARVMRYPNIPQPRDLFDSAEEAKNHYVRLGHAVS